MNSRRINSIRIILLSFWVISVLFSYYYFYNTYSKHAVLELGNKATIAAISLKDEILLEENDIERLLNLEFNDLLNDQSNIIFESKAREIMDVSDIKYIYVQMILPDEKVKYYVTEDTKDYYENQPGTPLNVIYYMDAVKDDQTRLDDTDGQWYSDEDRYTTLKDDLIHVYENKEISVFINDDEWGSYISSYVPLLSEDDEVIAVVCADLFLDNFNSFSKDNYYIVGGLTLGNFILLVMLLYFIYKKKELDSRLEETLMASSTDFLTRVMNRKRFMDILNVKYETAIKGKMKFSFIFIDIDFFKEYNDYYGHQAGDYVLYKIGKVLRKITERFSGISGRYGGDELIKILNEIFEGLEELKIKNEFLGEEKYQTLSMGAAMLDHSNITGIEKIISNADEALYMSKNHGRNMAHIHNGMEIIKVKRFN